MTQRRGPGTSVLGRLRLARCGPAAFLPRTRAAGSRSTRGFTLLEVLIAVVLSTILMAGLWALFDTYEVLFSRGQAKVENAQLIRALFEQIASDLQSAIPDSSAGTPGESASVRRFGLFGTASALQVDVLQFTDAHWARELVGADEAAESERTPNVPELHTVQYLFQEAGEEEEESRESGTLVGLVRRELDWEVPARDPRSAGGAGRTFSRSRFSGGSASTAGSRDPMSLSLGELDPEDNSLLQAPEVVKLEFRYYDGSGWTTQWNSLTQKSLPVAVEVVLALKRPQESRRAQQAAVASGESESEEVALADDASEEDALEEFLARPSDSAESPEYRLLVFLPAASQPQAFVRPPRQLPAGFTLPPVLPPPQSAPPRSPAPQSGPRPGSLRAVLPDQWMRAGS